MEPCQSVFTINCHAWLLSLVCITWQVEQQVELRELLNKYGDSWEPYKTALAKYKNGGKDL